MSQKTNLLDYERHALAGYFIEHGEKRFRADQVIQWVHQNGVADFEQMTNISKTLRSWLAEHCEIRLPEIIRDELSSDGTRKWLLRLDDGNAIETVFIPESDRGTLCISSQAGCILDCTFCATAQQGFSRNLTTGEILAQVWLANKLLNGFNQKQRVVSNIVMMGMGEPLYNYRNVIPALKTFMDDHAYGLSSRRVTLSTAGVVPNIEKLSSDCDVALAISLHAPNDELRNQLVPLNQRFPIKVLLDACRRYVGDRATRKITIEYVMLKGVNDKPEHAHQLVRILKGLRAKVNLIPFNPYKTIPYQCSEKSEIERFNSILQGAGLVSTVRKTRGQDIDAACGQLAGSISNKLIHTESSVRDNKDITLGAA
jgi:23S rRNA (adenine2503-C2)-methyltransferase